MTAAVLREVRLYGPLAKQFGRVFRLAVQTPAEAARALCSVLPGFRAAFIGPDGSARYHVFLGRGARRHPIDAAAKDDLVDADSPIRIVPAVEGAKRAGLGQTIVGAVLVVVGVVLGVYGTITGNPAAYQAGITIGNIGLAMMAGGIVQMLSPQRKQADKTVNDPSYGMDAGAVNITDSGTPVPLAYGRIVCGSVQVSGALVTDNVYPTFGGIHGGLPGKILPDYMEDQPVDGGSIIWRD